MSNTTITPEERRMFAEDSKYVLDRSKDIEFKAAAEAILRLLTALEAAEARAEQAETSLQESISRQELMAKGIEDIAAANHALAENAQKAESEVERLTKMVDWLAELVFDRPCAYACCPFDKHRPTGPDDDDCDKTHIQCWAEAASRAVAESEVGE